MQHGDILATDAETLESLLAHPGWSLFLQHVTQEWGAGGARFETRLNQLADSTVDDANALLHIRQIAVARREILKILEWPREELARVRSRPAISGPATRRGGL